MFIAMCNLTQQELGRFVSLEEALDAANAASPEPTIIEVEDVDTPTSTPDTNVADMWMYAARSFWKAADEAREAGRWQDMRTFARKAQDASQWADVVIGAVFEAKLPEGENMKAARQGMGISPAAAQEARNRVIQEMKSHKQRPAQQVKTWPTQPQATRYIEGQTIMVSQGRKLRKIAPAVYTAENGDYVYVVNPMEHAEGVVAAMAVVLSTKKERHWGKLCVAEVILK